MASCPTSLGLDAQSSNSTARLDMNLDATLIYSAMTAKQVGKKAKVHAQRQVRKAQPKNEISEQKLTLEDRLLFHQAKVKET